MLRFSLCIFVLQCLAIFDTFFVCFKTNLTIEICNGFGMEGKDVPYVDGCMEGRTREFVWIR